MTVLRYQRDVSVSVSAARGSRLWAGIGAFLDCTRVDSLLKLCPISPRSGLPIGCKLDYTFVHAHLQRNTHLS